ncbi:MAG: hypothetical protein CBB71_00480 [Rhodopirellula sp. TMED11]|nr:MAG: hypothetical protein CBB71_00480 [Rhodopirellula sp. TMED11]
MHWLCLAKPGKKLFHLFQRQAANIQARKNEKRRNGPIDIDEAEWLPQLVLALLKRVRSKMSNKLFGWGFLIFEVFPMA